MPSSVVTWRPIPTAGITIVNNSSALYTVAADEYVRVTLGGVGYTGAQVRINGSSMINPGSAGSLGMDVWLDEADTIDFSASVTTAGYCIQEFNK